MEVVEAFPIQPKGYAHLMFWVMLSSEKFNSRVCLSKTIFSITVPNVSVVAKISGSFSEFRFMVLA